MSDTVISIENLSKRYRLGVIGTGTLRNDIKLWLAKKRGMPNPLSTVDEHEQRNYSDGEIWALRDINFEVKQGESLGIIGRNGAGKSTLLKILSRVTAPTRGRVRVKGRIASLLEVGTGFHPELTGRENVYLNGAIMGMRKAEVASKFDEIVDFSGIEKFIETPVKRYSSGMYVRLAFAVAAHLDPDILVVDEVLAVGDVEFQKKCLGKMGNVASEGRAILFVSHNMASVQNLCDRGILLRNGRIDFIGDQTTVIDAYLSSKVPNTKDLTILKNRIGRGEIRVKSIEIVNRYGKPIDSACSGQKIGIRLFFNNLSKLQFPRLIVSISVKTKMDIPVFLCHNRMTREPFGLIPTSGFFELKINKLPLPPDIYHIDFTLMSDGSYIDGLLGAIELPVSDGDYYGSGEVPPSTHGLCLIDGKWTLNATQQ